MKLPTRSRNVPKQLITDRIRRAVNIVHSELGPVCVKRIISDLRSDRSRSDSFNRYAATAPKGYDSKDHG